MNERKILINLILQVQKNRDFAEIIADHLLANGVTFRKYGQWGKHNSENGVIHWWCPYCHTNYVSPTNIPPYKCHFCGALLTE